MTRRGKVLVAALLLGVSATVAVAAPRILHRASFFRIHEIEVTGLRYLDRDEVVRRLLLARDASIADPVAPILAAAEAIPGVVAASVEKRMPGTLRVSVFEAVPVALAAQSERLVLLDSRGHVLPFDPARVPVSLPIAEADSATAAALTRVMTTDPAWFARIERAHREGGDVLFDEGPHRVRLRLGATPATLRAISAVRDYLDRKAVGWREIDARYQDRVFVRKGSA
ncbi:MAG: FtsQ-type POTRA domain-containing protein [Gemmatimonadales bacterium]